MKSLSLSVLSQLTTFYSLKNCSVYGESCRNYSPKLSRLFWQEFSEVLNKNKNVIHQLRSGSVLGKIAHSVLSTALGLLLRAVLKVQFFPIRTSRLANNIYICFEIAVDPCNLVGFQQCHLITNRIIFCSKLHLFF